MERGLSNLIETPAEVDISALHREVEPLFCHHTVLMFCHHIGMNNHAWLPLILAVNMIDLSFYHKLARTSPPLPPFASDIQTHSTTTTYPKVDITYSKDFHGFSKGILDTGILFEILQVQTPWRPAKAQMELLWRRFLSVVCFSLKMAQLKF